MWFGSAAAKKVIPNQQCSPEICFKQVNPPFWWGGIILLVCTSVSLVTELSLSVSIVKQGRIRWITGEVCCMKRELTVTALSQANMDMTDLPRLDDVLPR